MGIKEGSFIGVMKLEYYFCGWLLVILGWGGEALGVFNGYIGCFEYWGGVGRNWERVGFFFFIGSLVEGIDILLDVKLKF